MLFPKKSRWNKIFLLLSGKMVFLFPENMLPVRRKMKDDLSQNNIRKYAISFKPSEKVVFSKRAQEIHENMIFSVYMTYGCYKCGTTPLCQKKNQRRSYPAKIHLKVNCVLDWYSRKSSSNSLYFHGDLYRRFHFALQRKNQET